jgi:hypothetical protein
LVHPQSDEYSKRKEYVFLAPTVSIIFPSRAVCLMERYGVQEIASDQKLLVTMSQLSAHYEKQMYYFGQRHLDYQDSKSTN